MHNNCALEQTLIAQNTSIVAAASCVDPSLPSSLKQRTLPLLFIWSFLVVRRRTVRPQVADLQTLKVVHEVSVRHPVISHIAIKQITNRECAKLNCKKHSNALAIVFGIYVLTSLRMNNVVCIKHKLAYQSTSKGLNTEQKYQTRKTSSSNENT